MEAVRLRVKDVDVDVDFSCLKIWNGKGGKHRVVTLAIPVSKYETVN
jgi:site-specific recombinase XerD